MHNCLHSPKRTFVDSLPNVFKNAISVVSLFICLALYFRWLPIYSGLTLVIVLSILVILKISKPTIAAHRAAILLLATSGILHLLRILEDSLQQGFLSLYLLDILNILTVFLIALFLRKSITKDFTETLSEYSIWSGVIISIAPIIILILALCSSFAPNSSQSYILAISNFINTNIDYNVIGFLILISLISLTFRSCETVYTMPIAAILSFAIIHSSSRRAVILLILLIPGLIPLHKYLEIKSIKPISLGIATAFTISLTIVAFAWKYPIEHQSVSRALVHPHLRPLSLFLTPEGFDRVYYKVISNIDYNHAWTFDGDDDTQLKQNDDDTQLKQKRGDLAVLPRKVRIESTLSLIDEFSTSQHLFGHSFYLRELGQKHKTGIDYPHNFLLTSYTSTGAIGLSLLIIILAIASVGLLKGLHAQNIKLLLMFLLSTIFSLTSDFSFWSFLPLPLLTLVGLAFFFEKKGFAGKNTGTLKSKQKNTAAYSHSRLF